VVTAWRQEGIKEAHFPPYVNVTFLLFLEVQCHWGLWHCTHPAQPWGESCQGCRWTSGPRGLLSLLQLHWNWKVWKMLMNNSSADTSGSSVKCFFSCLPLYQHDASGSNALVLIYVGLKGGRSVSWVWAYFCLFSTAWLSKSVLDFSKTRTITVSQAYHLASQSLASVDSVQEER